MVLYFVNVTSSFSVTALSTAQGVATVGSSKCLIWQFLHQTPILTQPRRDPSFLLGSHWGISLLSGKYVNHYTMELRGTVSIKKKKKTTQYLIQSLHILANLSAALTQDSSDNLHRSFNSFFQPEH